MLGGPYGLLEVRMSGHRALSLLSCCLLLSCGGSGSLDPGDGSGGPDYAPYDNPDALLANFVECWNHMDFAEYRDAILYDGLTPAADGAAYEPFKFYFIAPHDFYGRFWSVAEEAAHTETLFSGAPAMDGSPGVAFMDLEFVGLSDWLAPLNPYTVEGDPYPEGTRFKRFQTHLDLSLKECNSEGHDAYRVGDVVDLYVIPVMAGDQVEYRLWKWRDLDRGVPDAVLASWTEIKTLY